MEYWNIVLVVPTLFIAVLAYWSKNYFLEYSKVNNTQSQECLYEN